jgi:hypothetical protein
MRKMRIHIFHGIIQTLQCFAKYCLTFCLRVFIGRWSVRGAIPFTLMVVFSLPTMCCTVFENVGSVIMW